MSLRRAEEENKRLESELRRLKLQVARLRTAGAGRVGAERDASGCESGQPAGSRSRPAAGVRATAAAGTSARNSPDIATPRDAPAAPAAPGGSSEPAQVADPEDGFGFGDAEAALAMLEGGEGGAGSSSSVDPRTAGVLTDSNEARRKSLHVASTAKVRGGREGGGWGGGARLFLTYLSALSPLHQRGTASNAQRRQSVIQRSTAAAMQHRPSVASLASAAPGDQENAECTQQ